MNETPTHQDPEISDLKNSVALLTALLARGAERAEQDAHGTGYKSPALLAHEALTAKVALALKPKTEIPPENSDDYVTILVHKMNDENRDSDWFQSCSGIVLHDADADQYVEFALHCEIPCFVPKRFWNGSFPRESGFMNRLVSKGLITVKPGVVIDSHAVAKEWGESVGAAYLYAGTSKSRLSEDDLLRVAKLVDPFEPKLARDLRSLAAGVAVQPSAFGITGGETDGDDGFFDN